MNLADRLRSGAPVLGALIGDGAPVPPGLDLVVVEPGVPLTSGVATLVRTDDPERAAAALRAGAVGVVASAPLADVSGVVVTGAAVVVSLEAARTAFARGAAVVLYDLPAMLAGLADARPAVRLGREPLVLLSGMLGDEHLWDDVRLEDVAVPWPLRIDLDDSVEEMAASVLAAAPPSFALAGHSLGAIVALEVQRQAPERVTRLALLNASARGAEASQLSSWASCREAVDAGRFDDIAHELAVATLPVDRPDLVARNAAMARTVGPDGLRRQLAAQATRPDSRDRLDAVTVPVLVVSGTEDMICPAERQEELRDGCPDARLVTLDGGHMLPLEAPDAVTSALREWLRTP